MSLFRYITKSQITENGNWLTQMIKPHTILYDAIYSNNKPGSPRYARITVLDIRPSH